MNTSTPGRTAMAPYNSPTKSAPRRALGDLTPRGVNTPRKQIHDSATWSQSPLKQVQTLSPLAADKENTPRLFASQLSRKRSIEEVEGTEHVTNARKIGRGFAIDAQKLLSSSQTVDNNAGQEERGSTTEEDTPPQSQAQPLEVAVSNSQSYSQESISDFINWPGSQEDPPSSQLKKSSSPTRADLLRLRLGFATYKVKTNQISRPASLILSSFETGTPISTSLSSSSTMTITATTQTTSTQSIPSITVHSPARSVHSTPGSVIHVKANLDPGRPIPKLSAAPILLPTAYSSRMMGSPRHYNAGNVPSSPPGSDLPKCVSPEQVMSPMRAGYRTPAARRIREDNYDDDGEDGLNTEDMTVQERAMRLRGTDAELTSSAVKGHAAMGLLDLMTGRR